MQANMRPPTPALNGLLAAIALGASGIAAGGAAGATQDARATCHGLPVTVDEHRGVVHGTPGPDVIRLTRPGTVYGGRGRDIICGSSGRDRIFPGGGDDVVLAGSGADLIRAGAGRDSVFGEAGADRIFGGPGRDTIVSGAGDDTVARTATVAASGDRAAHASGDTISFNQHAASILIDAQGLDVLRAGGRSVSIARSPNSEGMADQVIPIWATTAAPFSSNTVTWPDDRYSVYYSVDDAVSGSVVNVSGSVPAQPGSGWSLEADGVFASRRGAPAGILVASEFRSVVMTGLTQAWTLNGAIGSGPLSATALVPGGSAFLLPPKAISVFVTSEAQAGEILPLPANRATAELSRGRPTATFVYSADRGGFTTEQAPG